MLEGHLPQLILDDESESSDSEQKEIFDKKIKHIADQKPKVERDSSQTLSSKNPSSASESVDEKEGKKSSTSPKRASSASTGSMSEAGTSKAQQVEQEVQVTKKRRTDRDGTAIVTATTSTVRREDTRPVSTGRIKGNAKPGRQTNERFRRVDPTKHEPITDNRYAAKVSPLFNRCQLYQR